jgi:hypothetical protein
MLRSFMPPAGRPGEMESKTRRLNGFEVLAMKRVARVEPHSRMRLAWMVVLLSAACGGRLAAEPDVEMTEAGSSGSLLSHEASSSSGSGADYAVGGSSELDAASTGDACALTQTCKPRTCTPTNASSPASGGGFGAPECTTVFGWGWDGSKCVAIVGCECVGDECATLLPARSACVAAYGRCM